jgi:hypothetical protein
MKKLLLNDFRVEGELFYTEAVQFYCSKAGIDSVSSINDINRLQIIVTELMNSDSKCTISSSISKENIINNYFTALRIELRDN